MKKIINGKKYDTETAKYLASGSGGGSASDFSHYAEELYIKKTGEYFLYGHGGPASKYAKYCGGNDWSGGSDITPLTENGARIWCERHCNADKYEEIFGEVEE